MACSRPTDDHLCQQPLNDENLRQRGQRADNAGQDVNLEKEQTEFHTKDILKLVLELPTATDLNLLSSKTDDLQSQGLQTKFEIQSLIQNESHTIQKRIDLVEESFDKKLQGKFGKQEGTIPRNPCVNRHSADNLQDRNPAFSGRVNILETISSKLNKGVSTICQRTTVTGLGGIGKSQTALEFAHRNRNLYTLIRWVDSDNTSLQNSLFQFAKDLKIPTCTVNKTVLEEIAKRIYIRLQQIQKWLLIFDNVEDHNAIQAFLPQTSSLQPNQHILITSQDQQWENEPIFLDVFSDNEALEYLKRYFKSGDEELYRLAQTLGNLPIALNHARAFIKQTPGLAVSDYLQLLESDFLDVISEDLVGAEKTVMKTFLTTINRICENDTHAVQILYQCAMVSPDNIPGKLFYGSDSCKLKTMKSLRVLKNYSMISSEEQSDVFSIHRLLQKVLINNLGLKRGNTNHAVPNLYTDILQHLIQRFELVCPEIKCVEDAHLVRLLLPHLSVLLEKLDKHKDDIFKPLADRNVSIWCNIQESVLQLYFNALREIQDREAIRIGEILLTMLEQRGAQLNNPHCYASVLSKVGQVKLYMEHKYEDSCKCFQQAIDILESKHGEAHISTAKPTRRLGTARLCLGDRVGAMDLYTKAVRLYEKNNETNKDGYADALNCTGFIHKQDGKNAEALELFQKSITIYEKLYGKNNIKSIKPLRNIGIVLRNMDQFEESLRYHKTVLAIRRQFFGNKHLQCSYSLDDIEDVLKAQNKSDDAMECRKMALELRENALGKDYPDCAYSFLNVGLVVEKQEMI